jgi:hypothetical protein
MWHYVLYLVLLVSSCMTTAGSAPSDLCICFCTKCHQKNSQTPIENIPPVSLRSCQRHRKDFSSDFHKHTRVAYLALTPALKSLVYPQYIAPLQQTGRLTATEHQDRREADEAVREYYNAWVQGYTDTTHTRTGNIKAPHEHFTSTTPRSARARRQHLTAPDTGPYRDVGGWIFVSGTLHNRQEQEEQPPPPPPPPELPEDAGDASSEGGDFPEYDTAAAAAAELDDAALFEQLSPDQSRRLSIGEGPINGVPFEVPEALLQRQPGQDGGQTRRRLEPRAYTLSEHAKQQYSHSLKKLFLNILLFKAQHPQ